MRNLIVSLLVVCIAFSCKKTDVDLMSNRALMIGNLYYDAVKEKFNNSDTVLIDRGTLILNNPYKNNGKIKLKGSIHNHTNNSEQYDSFGSGDPQANAALFRDVGFHFFTHTDHNFLTPTNSVSGITYIGLAYEDTKIPQHLGIHNLPENIYNLNLWATDINEIMRYYRQLDAFIILNHPDWSRQVLSNQMLMSMDQPDFIEVYSCDGGSERAFNILNFRFKGRVYGVGSDDYHSNVAWEDRSILLNKAWIEVYCDYNDRENIWQHIFAGSFYSTKGDTKIDVSCVDGELKITSEYVSKVEFISNAQIAAEPWRTIVRSTQNGIEASYQIQGDEMYVYAKILNEGGVSITQPIYIDFVRNNK